jgi:hypothetical protein
LNRKPVDPRAALRAAAQRRALRALKKAERMAAKAGVDLSQWEGEFLASAAERVKTYGRAFADPEKGAPGQALSLRQALKLKEIAAKASGKEKARFGRPRRDKPASEG